MRFAFSPFFAAIFRQKAADERTDKSRINERLPEGLEGGAVGRPKTTFKRVILLSLTVIGLDRPKDAPSPPPEIVEELTPEEVESAV